MNERETKTIAEIEVLIRVLPDELTEPDIENYLRVAEIQEKLDQENYLAALLCA